jgi:exopolyphosphatase/guanosine-5'-triphosphate,3'-diphosphate pyrophosphatase
MKPDRADVIVPAAEIFLRIMKQLDIQKVLIPKVGLADGIVHQMYERILDDLAETDKI